LVFVTQINPLLKKIRTKNDFYIFVPNDLDLLPFDLKFALPVTRVHGHVLVAKFVVSVAFRSDFE